MIVLISLILESKIHVGNKYIQFYWLIGDRILHGRMHKFFHYSCSDNEM